LERRRQENLDKRILAFGIVLIIIALILGAVQHFGVANIYGSDDNKWLFYGLVAVIGLIGIILAAWSYMRKPKK
jgi:Na+/melibiose symporter-like transporter